MEPIKANEINEIIRAQIENFDASMTHRLEERLVVPILEKDLATTVAAIDDVVTNPADRGSSNAWHEEVG